MASQWYYQKDGQRNGPISSAQLKQLADSGTLHPADIVWKEGLQQWVKASKVSGLFVAGTAEERPPTVTAPVAQEPNAAPSAADPKPEKKGFFASVFGPKAAVGGSIESYSVVYLGGHPDYPKSKAGGIDMHVCGDRFEFAPTMGTKGWFKGLVIPYDQIVTLEIVQRQVGTVEGILGGLNTRQLNQPNNINITYGEGESQVLLRLEMLSGITVMGQAKKCQEFMDHLRVHHIQEKFRGKPQQSTGNASPTEDIPALIQKLAKMKEQGLITAEEFESKKKELLARL